MLMSWRGTYSDLMSLIDQHEEWYRETGNSIHPWIVISMCAQLKYNLPDWVLGYLAEAAPNLLDAESIRDIGAALGFRGRDLQRARSVDQGTIIAMVARDLFAQGLNRKEVVAKCEAWFAVSDKTVERALTLCGVRSPP